MSDEKQPIGPLLSEALPDRGLVVTSAAHETGSCMWDCSCRETAFGASEDAVTESGYRHEGTDRKALLDEIARLRVQRDAVLAALESWRNGQHNLAGSHVALVKIAAALGVSE